MKFADIPQQYQKAILDYRDAFNALSHNHRRTWKVQLIDDWLQDHRRQWGDLRVVRNFYAVDGLQAFLDTVPKGPQSDILKGDSNG